MNYKKNWMAVFWCLVAFSSLTAAPLQVVSTASRPSATPARFSMGSVVSRDGRFVLFSSPANQLTANDSPGETLDIFIRDLSLGKTTLVSVAAGGQGGGNG